MKNFYTERFNFADELPVIKVEQGAVVKLDDRTPINEIIKGRVWEKNSNSIETASSPTARHTFINGEYVVKGAESIISRRVGERGGSDRIQKVLSKEKTTWEEAYPLMYDAFMMKYVAANFHDTNIYFEEPVALFIPDTRNARLKVIYKKVSGKIIASKELMLEGKIQDSRITELYIQTTAEVFERLRKVFPNISFADFETMLVKDVQGNINTWVVDSEMWRFIT